MQNSFDIIPHIVVNPSSIVSYNAIIYHKPKAKKHSNYIDVEKQIEDQLKFINSSRKNDGTLSIHAKRKLEKAIEYLIVTSKDKKVKEKIYGKTVIFKTAFITLTLPSKQIHKDSEIINKCLNSFLIELTRYHGLQNYVWRAERQKNGNIHFHILIDKFIPWNELRNRWNRIINKLGYVDQFQAIHGNKTPNSTDIHSTRKVKNIKAYISKYMTKQDQTQQIDESGNINNNYQSGRIWSCNHELSNTRGLNLMVDSEISEEMKKIINSGEARKFESTYFSVYYLDYHVILKSGSKILFKYFSDYLFEKLGFSEQLQFD